jgi:hypothetical protein
MHNVLKTIQKKLFLTSSLKINIVTEPEPGWILRRLANSFAEELDAKVSTEADLQADINFYVNYALFKQKTKCDIGFFTHREHEQTLADDFDQIAQQIDWCIAMCSITANLLPAEKTSIIKVAPDKIFMKSEIVFGVIGREYASGRKRFNWVEKLQKIPGIKIIVTNGKLDFCELPDFYKSIDYLLVLSDNEGGPVPVLEALAMGVPVIAPNVGFCWDFTVHKYNTYEDLLSLINGLIIPKNAWQIAGMQLLGIFEKVRV